MNLGINLAHQASEYSSASGVLPLKFDRSRNIHGPIRFEDTYFTCMSLGALRIRVSSDQNISRVTSWRVENQTAERVATDIRSDQEMILRTDKPCQVVVSYRRNTTFELIVDVGFEDTLFHPEFLRMCKNRPVRFMQSTGANTIPSDAVLSLTGHDPSPPSPNVRQIVAPKADAHFAKFTNEVGHEIGQYLPEEMHVAMVNACGASSYWYVHVPSTHEYLVAKARYIRDNIQCDEITFEFLNEMWNYAPEFYNSWKYATDRGIELWGSNPPYGDPNSLPYMYHLKATLEQGKIFKDIVEQNGRTKVKITWGAFTANAWHYERCLRLHFDQDFLGLRSTHALDSVAIAPYVSGTPATEAFVEGDIDRAVRLLNNHWQSTVRGQVEAWLKICERHSLALVFYEDGHHIRNDTELRMEPEEYEQRWASLINHPAFVSFFDDRLRELHRLGVQTDHIYWYSAVTQYTNKAAFTLKPSYGAQESQNYTYAGEYWLGQELDTQGAPIHSVEDAVARWRGESSTEKPSEKPSQEEREELEALISALKEATVALQRADERLLALESSVNVLEQGLERLRTGLRAIG